MAGIADAAFTRGYMPLAPPQGTDQQQQPPPTAVAPNTSAGSHQVPQPRGWDRKSGDHYLPSSKPRGWEDAAGKVLLVCLTKISHVARDFTSVPFGHRVVKTEFNHDIRKAAIEMPYRCLFCHRDAVLHCADCWLPLCFEHYFRCDRDPSCGWFSCWDCHEDHVCIPPGSLRRTAASQLDSSDSYLGPPDVCGSSTSAQAITGGLCTCFVHLVWIVIWNLWTLFGCVIHGALSVLHGFLVSSLRGKLSAVIFWIVLLSLALPGRLFRLPAERRCRSGAPRQTPLNEHDAPSDAQRLHVVRAGRRRHQRRWSIPSSETTMLGRTYELPSISAGSKSLVYAYPTRGHTCQHCRSGHIRHPASELESRKTHTDLNPRPAVPV